MHRPRLLPLLAVAFPCAVATPAERGDYSDRWDRFVILVWQYRTPPPGPQAEKAYADAGLHGLHLDGGFPQKLLDFARAVAHLTNLRTDASLGNGTVFTDQWRECEANLYRFTH